MKPGRMNPRGFLCLCEDCSGEIVFEATPGGDPQVRAWVHTDPTDLTAIDHAPKPELRFAIDATCPSCEFPEIGYSPNRLVFACSRCGFETETRPAA